MKFIRILVIFLGALSFSALALGDLYFEQTITTGGIMGQPPQSFTQKVWISKGNMCTENSLRQQRIIYKADLKTIVMVDLNKRTYTEITVEQFKEMTGMFAAMLGQQGGTFEFSIKKTGRTQRIDSWNCYEVLIAQPGDDTFRMEIWLTKDIKYDKALFDQYTEIFSAFLLTQKMLDEWKKLEGFPVKTITKMKFGEMKIESSGQVTKVSHAAISADIFSIPEGFEKTEFKMPQMP